MGIFGRGARQAKSIGWNQSVEDTEGLVINNGIVNALILSFTVPIFVSVSMEAFDRLDFWALCNQEEKFREFVIWTMDSQDFAWNFSFGPVEVGPFSANTTINLKDVLRHGPYNNAGTYNIFNVGAEDNQKVELAIELLQNKFPMDRMRAYRIFAGSTQSGSDIFFQLVGPALGLQSGGLFVTVLLYIALCLSDARESSVVLQRFNAICVPIIVLLYFLTALAFVLFFGGLTALAFAYSPRLYSAIYVRHVGLYAIALPMAVIGVAACGLIARYIRRAGGRSEVSPGPNVQAAESPVVGGNVQAAEPPVVDQAETLAKS